MFTFIREPGGLAETFEPSQPFGPLFWACKVEWLGLRDLVCNCHCHVFARSSRLGDFSRSFWLLASLEVQVCRSIRCHHVLLCFVRYNKGSKRDCYRAMKLTAILDLYTNRTHGLHNHMDYCACTNAYINICITHTTLHK